MTGLLCGRRNWSLNCKSIMKDEEIVKKFGGNYRADKNTFKMGIDRRITVEIAKRFKGLRVLETCTGGGFSTIALARVARSVSTVEINRAIQNQAKENIKQAKCSNKVTFILGDVMNKNIVDSLPPFDAAFLDPDWADNGQDHIYRFINSTTRPPADKLFKKILHYTKNIALVLPPVIPKNEFANLPALELQNIYLDGELVLFCLYFGTLMYTNTETKLII